MLSDLALLVCPHAVPVSFLLCFCQIQVVFWAGWIGVGWSLGRFLADWFGVPCSTEFVFRLLVLSRAFPRIYVLLISFKDDMIVKGIFIEIFLFALTQISADIFFRVNRFVMPISPYLDLLFRRILFLLVVMLIGKLKNSLLLR